MMIAIMRLGQPNVGVWLEAERVSRAACTGAVAALRRSPQL
jgi:hypothetical protein